MKRLYAALAALLILAPCCFGQSRNRVPDPVVVSGAPTGACTTGFRVNSATSTLYACVGGAWVSVGGGGGGATNRVLVAGPTAVCQSGLAAISGSLPSSNAPTATCEADGLSAYAAFTYNSGSGQTMYQRVALPQDWAGTLKLNIAGWSTSTSAASVKVQTGCVGTSGVTTGVTFNSVQTFTFTPNASSNRTTSTANSLTTTGCSAGNELAIKYNIVGESGGTAVNIRTLQVTE